MRKIPRPVSTVPDWALWPLPINAELRDADVKKLDKLNDNLPERIWDVTGLIEDVATTIHYDALVNEVTRRIWPRLDECLAADAHDMLKLAESHLTPRLSRRVIRRLARHRDTNLRRSLRRHLESHPVHEVALPATPDGDWDATSWIPASGNQLLRKRKRKKPPTTLPAITSVKALMKKLEIASPRQLGWMLLASEGTEESPGPYTTFEISKRSGQPRTICAPKWQLRRVQQKILSEILDHVPPHPAAHGFVKGRSTVSNAAPHQSKALILKFDLTDFFPSIHYHRVIGLFASMGYGLRDQLFSTETRSKNIAPVLARLCTYTEDPRRFRDGVLPQGAPTSPAISNLICRRLDARLAGLADKHGADYTRYADDLTFSFDEDAAEEMSIGRFRWWVDQVCHQEGFLVNQGKFRAIRPSQRQSVTGIVVNERLRAPREIRRRVRAMLHNLRTKGLKAVTRKDPHFASYLQGLASYIYMIDQDEGSQILNEARELLKVA